MAAQWQKNYKVYQKYLQGLSDLYESRQDVRIFLEVLLSLTAVIVFGAFAIRPTLVTIASLFTEIKGKEETLQIMNQKIENLLAAQQLFESNKQAIQLLSQAVPNEATPESVVRQLEGIGVKNNVLISHMTVSKIQLKGAATSILDQTGSQQVQLEPFPQTAPSVAFSLRATGNFISLSTFLKDLENMRRPIFVDKISFGVPEEKGVSNLTIVINGRSAFLPSTQ